MDIDEQTSIKGLFQSMITNSMGVLLGKVVSAGPLKIQAVNDDKLLLSENLLCVPKHLSNYTVTCDLELENTSSGNQTERDDQNGDGKTYIATLTIHNALNVGDTVYLLSYNDGKKYYVLDRVV